MLAYELYLQNKSASRTSARSRKPIKKIFFNKGTVTVDEKTPEEYGDELEDGSARHILSMPFNTSPGLGLQSRVTGSNQARPYVELFGEMRRREGRLIFSISRKGKQTQFTATFDAQERIKEIEANGVILLNIDRKNYFIEGENLFQLYVNAGVLTKNSELTAKTFAAVCESFFDYLSGKRLEDVRDRAMRFSLFVLPSNGEIEYKEHAPRNEQDYGIDSFGEHVSFFPIKTTQTAKFLSYDDPAFTINFLAGAEFYRNLFIGNTSHERINVDAGRLIQIAGLEWVFSYTGDPSFRFKDKKKGIYHQLFWNYRSLEKKAGDPFLEKAQTNVLCIKRSQAKLEVLIHENLTMDRMRKMFATVQDGAKIPPLALEVLIQEKDRHTLWWDYIDVLRAFIAGRSVQGKRLTAIFSRMARENIFDWLKDPRQAHDFFERSKFCRTILSKEVGGVHMNEAEDYAYRAGRIAGRYIRFKEQANEASSSLRDILIYSKYDRDKLRFVIQRVGLGINLSKASLSDIDDVSRFVKDEMSRTKEIPDGFAYDDYSYFFYKGVFETLT